MENNGDEEWKQNKYIYEEINKKVHITVFWSRSINKNFWEIIFMIYSNSHAVLSAHIHSHFFFF